MNPMKPRSSNQANFAPGISQSENLTRIACSRVFGFTTYKRRGEYVFDFRGKVNSNICTATESMI